jgi:hypothetical protein
MRPHLVSLLSCKYEIHQSGVLVCRHLHDSINFIGTDQLWSRTKIAKVGDLFDRLSIESNALSHLPKVDWSVVQKAHPSLRTVHCKDLKFLPYSVRSTRALSSGWSAIRMCTRACQTCS